MQCTGENIGISRGTSNGAQEYLIFIFATQMVLS